MVVLAVAGQFLTQTHRDSLGALLLAVVTSILSLLPLVVVWLQLRLKKEIRQLREELAHNGEKLNAIKQHVRASSESAAMLGTGDMSPVRETDMDRPALGHRPNAEHRRHNSPDSTQGED
jgi:hypothetical protein